MTRDALVEKVAKAICLASDMDGDAADITYMRQAAIDAIDIVLEEAAKIAKGVFPRGSAHTYSSENADAYRAQEYAGELIAEHIRALKGDVK